MLTGKARIDHLADVRKKIRWELTSLLHRHVLDLSYAEAYGEMLGAVEDFAGLSAEAIRKRAAICRDEYCKPGGGAYENIKQAMKDVGT